MNKNEFNKAYKLYSDNNEYKLYLKSIQSNNQKILNIKVTHLLNEEISFYTQKNLEEIHKEYSLEYDSIESLINYLASLTSSNNIRIDRINKLIYNLNFFDDNNNKEIKFILKREIGRKEIEEEILNLYKKLEAYENIIENLQKEITKKQNKIQYLNNIIE